MKRINQHGKLNYYINMALIYIAMALFTIPLTAAEQPEKYPSKVKFELRLASYEHVAGWEESSLPSGGSVWIAPEVTINNADVLQAEPKEMGDEFLVEFLLTEDGALKFARFTKSNAGKFVAIMIDNRVLSAPKIISEIAGGRAMIQGKFTEKEASRLAKGIIGH